MSSQPVPARKPATTGYGMNRTRLLSRRPPTSRKTAPVRMVASDIARTTVRNCCSPPTATVPATAAAMTAADGAGVG